MTRRRDRYALLHRRLVQAGIPMVPLYHASTDEPLEVAAGDGVHWCARVSIHRLPGHRYAVKPRAYYAVSPPDVPITTYPDLPTLIAALRRLAILERLENQP